MARNYDVDNDYFDMELDVEDPHPSGNTQPWYKEPKVFIAIAGIAVFGLVLFGAGFGLAAGIGFGESTSSSGSGQADLDAKSDFPPLFEYKEELKKFTIRSKAIQVEPGLPGHMENMDVERPHGDVTVRDARFRILDENNQLLPLHRLYNHHVYLLRGDPDAHLPNWDETDNGTQTYTRLDAIAVIGAEGLTSPGIQVPDGYGFLCPADDTWFLGVHFVNEWGIASGANITAFVEVDVYYTEGVDTAESVNSWIMELDKTIRNYVEFDVPGTGGPGSTVSHSNTFTWKRDPITIVRAIPHIHIGGIEGTLEDVTHNKVIAHGRATYSDDDYIIGVESVFPEYTIETGTQLKITSVYDNSHNYGSVMSLFLIYATGLDDLHYFSDSFGDRDDDDCEGAYSEELCDNINGSGPNDGDDQNTTDNEAPQTFADGANGDLIPEVGETDERDVAARESSATEVGKRQGEKIIQKSQ